METIRSGPALPARIETRQEEQELAAETTELLLRACGFHGLYLQPVNSKRNTSGVYLTSPLLHYYS
jgi:hypothetical protein